VPVLDVVWKAAGVSQSVAPQEKCREVAVSAVEGNNGMIETRYRDYGKVDMYSRRYSIVLCKLYSGSHLSMLAGGRFTKSSNFDLNWNG
jgi:hypothetical protein